MGLTSCCRHISQKIPDKVLDIDEAISLFPVVIMAMIALTRLIVISDHTASVLPSIIESVFDSMWSIWILSW